MQHWRKLGLVYAPSGERSWARTHAAVPTADVLDDDVVRIYYATSDENEFRRIGYVDLDAKCPTRILGESQDPILGPGDFGMFDDFGVHPSCIIDRAGGKHLYYTGCQRFERVPYMHFAGLAIGVDGERFEKTTVCPVLDRTSNEPFLRSGMVVLSEQGVLKAWYISGVEWGICEGVQYPRCVIRYATSRDGVNWITDPRICIDLENGQEFGFERPWVINDGTVYRMWYSICSITRPFRIGYAESVDGINWTRLDDAAGIERSASGWDSEMVCHACVVDVKDRRYMFYNGNGHGSTGFGCASLEE